MAIPQGEHCMQCGAIMKLSKRDRDGEGWDEIGPVRHHLST